MIYALPLAAQALLTVLYSRALGGLTGLVPLLAALVVAALVGHLLARTQLRTWVLFAGAAATGAALRSVALWVLSSVAVRAASPGVATVLRSVDVVSLAALPVVVLGFSSAVAAVRRRALIRWEPLIHGLLLLGLLWSQGHYALTYFERPWAYVLIIGALVLADIVLLVEPRFLSHRFLVRLAVLSVPLLVLAVLLSFHWYAAGGTAAGGGILRPTLFRFDFAPFVRLESEISMSDDLLLLYRRSGRARRDLIRRYVLTDYDPRRGFTVGEPEAPHPKAGGESARELVRQEYFLVNLDPGTRLALNRPVGYVQFESWDESSFTSAFAAESMVSSASASRLARVRDADLPPAEARRLTDYGDNEAIRGLAREITQDVDAPFARARAIETYLHDNYYYSLRPGIAADGDQLSHFLFESKKGYCSYYAFSMALMVRSLGIPARVAVGFFADPRQEVLNFYPILANMAHAWVEVYLGEYGWISFDPTSQTLAPGEDYEIGSGADPEEIASLLEEILAQELQADELTPAPVEDAGRRLRLPAALESVLRRWYLVLPLLYLVAVALVRAAPWVGALLARDARRRARRRVRAVLVRAASYGIERAPGESLAEFGQRCGVDGMPELMELYERALFAPRFAETEEKQVRRATVRVSRGLRGSVPAWRRILGFLDPRVRRTRRPRVAPR